MPAMLPLLPYCPLSGFAEESDDDGYLQGREGTDDVGVEACGRKRLLKFRIAPNPVAQGACGTPGRDVRTIELSQFREAVTEDFEFLHVF